MKEHNKTTMLYVADWVAMASLEMDSKSGTDWEAVSRGFDPTITDQRETNFLDLVMSGQEQIGKVNYFNVLQLEGTQANRLFYVPI